MAQAAGVPVGTSSGAAEARDAVAEAMGVLEAQFRALPKEKTDGKTVGLVKAEGVGLLKVV